MSEKLAAYPLQTIRTILALKSTGEPAKRLLLAGKVLGPSSQPELGNVIADPFERWLVEKWLAEVRTPEFRETVERETLREQWEREG